MKKQKLSVVLATRNEEDNIEDCLKSVVSIADEIIICDEESSDDTVKIARKLGAKVISTKHKSNFHVTKQKALEAAHYNWILQLDADERITSSLAKEISNVLKMSDDEIKNRKYPKDKKKLFNRHIQILRKNKMWSDEGNVVAFWIPRLNFFLGKEMKYAGRYPDPAIRLVEKGKARFPMKSVHEFMQFNGATAWLFNDMLHMESPTLNRYLYRLNRYTDLQSEEHKKNKVGLSLIMLFYFAFIKPLFVFFTLYFRYKGFKDGMRGFVWCAFSASHFPISYFKYYAKEKNNNR